MTRPLVVWRFLDGRPGHENQTLGLINAMSDLTAVEVHPLAAHPGARPWLDLLLGRCPAAAKLPPPDLLVGAGHATHAPLLACRRRRGGRAVVLMRPSLPMRWFDLCIVPEHDGVAASDGVLTSRGVLNPIRPATDPDPGLGLILVGGPSSHYAWDERALCAEVAEIADRDRRHWIVATSRRTPPGTLPGLRGIDAANLEVVPQEDTAAGWLAGQLQRAAVAWVTEDSVSMLYEALTAGIACGVLPVPVRRRGRVRRGLERLLADGAVTRFADWQRDGRLTAPAGPLAEAARCARWIRDRWFAG